MANEINNIIRQNSSLTSTKKVSTGSASSNALAANEERQDIADEVTKVADNAGAKKEQSLEAINNAVEKLSSHVQNIKRELNFSVDETTGRVVIKVIDSETQELIRAIPPEEAIERAQFLNSSVGNLLKTKV